MVAKAPTNHKKITPTLDSFWHLILIPKAPAIRHKGLVYSFGVVIGSEVHFRNG